LTISFDDIEHAALSRAAAEQGVTVSGYARVTLAMATACEGALKWSAVDDAARRARMRIPEWVRMLLLVSIGRSDVAMHVDRVRPKTKRAKATASESKSQSV
jgi:hypothetical protein